MTLIAIPWVVTPRLTWIPIEPILRASPPESASSGERAATGVPCGPIVADRDRRRAGRPDAGQPVEDLGRDVVGGRVPPIITRSSAPHVGVDVGLTASRHSGQVDDRIGDQLSRAVVGDPAAAIGLDDLDPLHPVPVLAHPELARVGAAALGQDRMVLEQQQHVGNQVGLARRRERPLQRQDLLVGLDAEARTPELSPIGHGLSVAGAWSGDGRSATVGTALGGAPDRAQQPAHGEHVDARADHADAIEAPLRPVNWARVSSRTRERCPGSRSIRKTTAYFEKRCSPTSASITGAIERLTTNPGSVPPGW